MPMRPRSIAPLLSPDALSDNDLQIALFMLYELHYQGFHDAIPSMEWNPELLAIRGELEQLLLEHLREQVPTPYVPSDRDFAEFLFAMAAAPSRPSLSDYLARKATLDEFKEFVVHRSAYHLKEADPYTWTIPRLSGKTKSGLVEIQADEYGGGRLERMHSELFRRMMRELDLNDTYGYYIDELPAISLAGPNVTTMFGLHRELRGASVGHFAALEMTSSIPNRKYGNGLRRLGFNTDATWFFDEHVEADAVHEQLAVRNVCVPLANESANDRDNVLFGVASYLHLESRFGNALMDSWKAAAA